MLYSPTAPSGRWNGIPRAGPLSMPASLSNSGIASQRDG